MYQKTLLLIGILALGAAVLFYFALNRNTPQSPTDQTTNQPSSATDPAMQVDAAKTASLYFSPSTINTNSGSVDILLNTGGKEVSGVQIELSYDPNVVSSLTIQPAAESLFGGPTDYVLLIQNVDHELGRATLALGIAAGKQAVGGTGKVATITYTASGPTTISMLEKSAVTQLDVVTSVLSTVSSLTINPQ